MLKTESDDAEGPEEAKYVMLEEEMENIIAASKSPELPDKSPTSGGIRVARMPSESKPQGDIGQPKNTM